MKLHERHQATTQAGLDIDGAIGNAVHKHALTFPELVSILAAAISQWAKYAIRDERETEAEVDDLAARGIVQTQYKTLSRAHLSVENVKGAPFYEGLSLPEKCGQSRMFPAVGGSYVRLTNDGDMFLVEQMWPEGSNVFHS